MSSHIATFKNEQTNMQSFVTLGKFGFHVSLQDLDSGEFVPMALCYKDESKAIKKAQEVVGK